MDKEHGFDSHWFLARLSPVIMVLIIVIFGSLIYCNRNVDPKYFSPKDGNTAQADYQQSQRFAETDSRVRKSLD